MGPADLESELPRGSCPLVQTFVYNLFSAVSGATEENTTRLGFKACRRGATGICGSLLLSRLAHAGVRSQCDADMVFMYVFIVDLKEHF